MRTAYIVITVLMTTVISGCLTQDLTEDKKVNITATQLLEKTRKTIDPENTLKNSISLKFIILASMNDEKSKINKKNIVKDTQYYKKPDKYKSIFEVIDKTRPGNILIRTFNGKNAWAYSESDYGKTKRFHIFDDLVVQKRMFHSAIEDLTLGVFDEYEKLKIDEKYHYLENKKCYKLKLYLKNYKEKIVPVIYFIDVDSFKIITVVSYENTFNNKTEKIITDNIIYINFSGINLPSKYEKSGVIQKVTLTYFELNPDIPEKFFKMPPKTSEEWKYLIKDKK